MDGGGVFVHNTSCNTCSWLFSFLREGGDNNKDGEQDSEELYDPGSSLGRSEYSELTLKNHKIKIDTVAI